MAPDNLLLENDVLLERLLAEHTRSEQAAEPFLLCGLEVDQVILVISRWGERTAQKRRCPAPQTLSLNDV